MRGVTRRRHRRAPAVLAAFIVALALTAPALPAGAGGPLPAPPFDFSASPATVREGRPAAFHVTPMGRAAEGHGEKGDLYIVRLIGWERVQFLTPGGNWTLQPTAYVSGLSLSGFPAVVADFPEPRPIGYVHVGVIVARAGEDPLARRSWRFQPVFKMVAVRAALPREPGHPSPGIVLAGLGLAAASAGALLIAYPQRGGPDSAGCP